MSRLIVKGLPKKATEESLRNLFGSKGTITDIQLKYTKEGVFRQFAFVGYQTDDQAQVALKHFNNSYIQTNRIKVEVCAPLGSQEKPKAWSKYSKESSAYKAQNVEEDNQIDVPKEKVEKKNKKKERLAEILGEHKDDPGFVEFMQVHSKDRSVWSNDAVLVQEAESIKDPEGTKKESKAAKQESKATKNKGKQVASTSKAADSDESASEADKSESNDDIKLAEKEISDLEYMKSLMKKSSDVEKHVSKTTDKSAPKSKKDIELFTIKIWNLPYKVKRQDIVKFFKPIKPFSVRLPTKVRGFCYVGLKNERDFNKAMLKNKSFIKGKQVFFSDFTEKNKVSKNPNHTSNEATPSQCKNPKWQKQEDGLKNEEDISESGRIFFRNLAYTVNEDEIQQLFEKYGPVAEVSLPIDSITRQIKGFGTVTFVMPEHAVRAFSELDGTLFHGRLLHLIPGKARDNAEPDASEENLNFKQKKKLKQKQSAGQSHNWDTLFLGANAVADILAKRYDTSKENILDTSAGGSSAAVRLALGRTQIIMELKKFLEENDIHVDAFNTEPKKRSKTIILAKNLPAETTVADLKPIFSQFGLIGRIVLPPSGVTALIEFLEPSEARQAFKKLAYSNFKNLPLYLEWAPENTFKTKADADAAKTGEVKTEENNNTNGDESEDSKPNATISESQKGDAKTEPVEKSDDDEEEDPEPETTLFLRNLNFKTEEEAIREHFKHLGRIHIIQVAKRKDPDNPRVKHSLGYGFIQFKKKSTTEKALKTMQFTQIEGNQVELKRSDRTLKTDVRNQRKPDKNSKQTGTKILVRNIPFQAKLNEVRDIFKAFGELKSVRLPKKMVPGEDAHRGFGFVDFVTKSDAKKAFEAISRKAHLYGRPLVLEWASVDDDSVEEIRKRTAKNYEGSVRPNKMSRKSVFADDDAGDVDAADDCR